MPIFRVKSVKIYTGQKNLHWRSQWRQWQLSGMSNVLGQYPWGSFEITQKRKLDPKVGDMERNQIGKVVTELYPENFCQLGWWEDSKALVWETFYKLTQHIQVSFDWVTPVTVKTMQARWGITRKGLNAFQSVCHSQFATLCLFLILLCVK